VPEFRDARHCLRASDLPAAHAPLNENTASNFVVYNNIRDFVPAQLRAMRRSLGTIVPIGNGGPGPEPA
jgi:hypothetical protein